ncbi:MULTISPECIES: tyrosinase family oxidase copper chaperone [Streptomyces]|uniref:tyrosinase family oxidase copper chaperone n=1 Tax=Streptomyces TaxID=1883 RepID=UPI0002EE0B1F|nr:MULTISPECIES: tyrosinase family oxidase copper chaperone [Streptomyces]MCX4486772.1 tyrosinase cofactor [Streptomyces anulatus]MCX4523116.1 tyrosinase cofactor [Streptomyces anulatus]MCX4606127.1 tyrosinase cofactor [Streptomyces anulatus]WSI82111.1 tyrosinase cofactor [Streptomyces anulatus]WSU78055.1 tyrosinase cofactor [Streptomyces anulatus]
MSPTPAKPGGTRIPSRRTVLRGAFTAAVVTGTAGALLPLLDQERAAAARPAPAPEAPAPRPGSTPEEFAEMYRGREIRGTATVVVPAGAPDDDRVMVAAEPGSEIRIDGRPLHVMRRADGTYLSDVRHYESYPTLLETARAAVDELGAAGLAHPAAHRM